MRIEICPQDACQGCALCESLCPANAIEIKIQNGFYRPIISNKCISCNICVTHCPANNREKIQKHKRPDIAYAAWAKDNTIHYNSSSGGLAYLISSRFISNGGTVVGVWFNPATKRVEHRIYEKKENLCFMQGSKYVQSCKTEKIYKKAADTLNEKDVLFIGVPCEVFAMKQYINGKHYKHKISFIDLLCHGGSSPQCLQEHVNRISFGRTINNVTFRGGKYDCRFVLWGNSHKKLYCVGQYRDPYFLTFMKRSILQKACYSCAFAGSERTGDLTLGDFWGIDPDISHKTAISGINMLFINTENGQQLIDSIASEIIMFPRNTEEAIRGNDTLYEPTHQPQEYDALWKEINKKGFYKALKSEYGISWWKGIISDYIYSFFIHPALVIVNKTLRRR